MPMTTVAVVALSIAATETSAFVPNKPSRTPNPVEATALLCATVSNKNDSIGRKSINFDPPSSRFIRLQPRSVRGGSRQCLEVQTAVTTFERTRTSDLAMEDETETSTTVLSTRVNQEESDDATTTVDSKKQRLDLHAQIHYGTHDYFDYYNTRDFASQYDNVLYELLVDEPLLQTRQQADRSLSRLRYVPAPTDHVSPLMAPLSDRQMADSYGLSCQVDIINFAQPHWTHADLTRQEVLEQLDAKNMSADQPLWALASSAPSWPAVEALMALFRPTTPTTTSFYMYDTSNSNSREQRRLFSNLFLPGNLLLNILRGLFWILLPCPEISIVLLDWSSLLPRPTGGVTPVAVPVLSSILSGNILEARQLVFGQILVSGQRGSSGEQVLIQRRNERAMDVLEQVLQHSESKSTALLYGGMHCDDLTRRLKAAGFVPVQSRWRTAWTVTVPQLGTGVRASATPTTRTTGRTSLLDSFAATVSPTALAIGLVVLPLYFAVVGLDWIVMVQQMATALLVANDDSLWDFVFLLSLYLIRHVMVYIGLSKFVVEWDGTTSLFGNGSDK